MYGNKLVIMEKSRQWPQFLAAFSASILAIGNGIQLGWPSPSVPKMLANCLGFDISVEESSYIVMLSPLGYIIGSPMCGFLLDWIGRKPTLLILAPIQLITWLTIATSNSVWSLYASRILMGITEGGMFTALPAYIGEVIEPQIRGRAGTSISLGMLFGTLLINVYGSFVSIRTAAYISLSIPVIFILTFVWMPESPYYYLAKGNDHEARRSLQSLTKRKNVESELERLKKVVNIQLTEPGRVRDVFTVNSNLRAFVIIAMLRTIQQFSGIYVVGFYMQVIFENAQTGLPPHICAIICNAVNIIFTFIASFLIDRFGRKLMITWSSVGAALALATLGTYFCLQGLANDLDSFKWLPLAAMIVYYICCCLGLLVVPTLMMGELLPGNIKAKALALMNMYFGVCMSASSKLFQWTESSFGVHVPFYLYAAVCIYGIFFTYAFVPETKGKSLEEIQQILKSAGTAKHPREQKLVKIAL